MKTFYTVHRIVGKNSDAEFADQAAALTDAKRRQAADKDNRYAVMKAVEVTVLPVPNIETEALTE